MCVAFWRACRTFSRQPCGSTVPYAQQNLPTEFPATTVYIFLNLTSSYTYSATQDTYVISNHVSSNSVCYFCYFLINMVSCCSGVLTVLRRVVRPPREAVSKGAATWAAKRILEMTKNWILCAQQLSNY